MTLTDDFTLKCMKGSPVFLKDICAVFPRTVGDIVDVKVLDVDLKRNRINLSMII